MEPLISVIVPVYNVQDYLDECIESIIKQTYCDFELLLIDDGSRDNCPNICDKWAQNDLRIRVIHKENGGLSDARNVGLDCAKGEYISFIDSDDFVELNYLEKLYKALQDNPDCAISSCSLWMYKDGKITPPRNSWDFEEVRYVEPEEYADKMLTMESQHTSCCKLFRRDVLSKIRYRKGYVNEDILLALDFYPIVEREHYRIVEIPDKLLFYRQHDGSICNNKEIPFHITEFKNRKIVMEAVKDQKPLVYDTYKKRNLHDLTNMLSQKLNYLDTSYINYFSTCKELWDYSDSMARKELNKSEYATYVHCKYFAPIMWLKYFIKSKL